MRPLEVVERQVAGQARPRLTGGCVIMQIDLLILDGAPQALVKMLSRARPRLAALNLGVPITLFLDNARYQCCALVQTCTARLNIELCFLPLCSPNLNLIEQLWKFVKKQCLYSHYYADFAPFMAAISHCLEQTHTTHQAALDSLLTLRFQLFEKAQFVTA